MFEWNIYIDSGLKNHCRRVKTIAGESENEILSSAWKLDMLLNSGAGEDTCESLGLQGGQTSES